MRGLRDDATSAPRHPARHSGRWRGLLLIVALVLSLGVLLLNRGPLFYIDTVGYLAMGAPRLEKILGQETAPLPEAPAGEVSGDVSGEPPPAGVSETTTMEEERQAVGGSHSIVYALLLALLWRVDALAALPLVNALALFLAAWLPARAVARECGRPHLAAPLVAIPLIAGAAGALPFYVAYLMPDIFAPVLIIVIATLTVFGRRMERGEILLALALGSFAVVVHLSHLAIALMLLPVSAMASVLVSRRRWWLPPALVLAIAAVGLLYVKAFEFAAEVVTDRPVVYSPLVTARLITNGPGYDYLAEHCPDPKIDTCLLWDALSKSDDPWRLTPSHIIFSRDPRLGSYKLMPAEDRHRVAAEQREFFLRVLADRPLDTIGSLAMNTLTQTVFFSVDMTIPTPADAEVIRRHPDLRDASMGDLAGDRSWIEPLTSAHAAVYAASLLVIGGLLASGRRPPGAVRALVLMLLIGVLANAFVCGALSQAATRYGGRVIWLLPFAAAFLVMAALARPRPGQAGGNAAGDRVVSRRPDRQRT
jgi:hypothetical protein